MNKIFRLAFLAGLAVTLGFGALARAEQTGTGDPFQSYQSTMDYVRSQGMEPSKMNWNPITAMCLGLKTPSGADERPFNKCLYEKARDTFLHQSDKAQCALRVKSAYPDSLKNGRTDTLRETDKDGTVHVYERTSAPVSAEELEQQRSSFMVECMQNLGWASVNDWRLGKRKGCQ